MTGLGFIATPMCPMSAKPRRWKLTSGRRSGFARILVPVQAKQSIVNFVFFCILKVKWNLMVDLDESNYDVWLTLINIGAWFYPVLHVLAFIWNYVQWLDACRRQWTMMSLTRPASLLCALAWDSRLNLSERLKLLKFQWTTTWNGHEE